MCLIFRHTHLKGNYHWIIVISKLINVENKIKIWVYLHCLVSGTRTISEKWSNSIHVHHRMLLILYFLVFTSSHCTRITIYIHALALLWRGHSLCFIIVKTKHHNSIKILHFRLNFSSQLDSSLKIQLMSNIIFTGTSFFLRKREF